MCADKLIVVIEIQFHNTFTIHGPFLLFLGSHHDAKAEATEAQCISQ